MLTYANVTLEELAEIDQYIAGARAVILEALKYLDRPVEENEVRRKDFKKVQAVVRAGAEPVRTPGGTKLLRFEIASSEERVEKPNQKLRIPRGDVACRLKSMKNLYDAAHTMLTYFRSTENADSLVKWQFFDSLIPDLEMIVARPRRTRIYRIQEKT